METQHPLRVMRKHYNLSIDALAEATNLSRRTILRAEQGYIIHPSSRHMLCAYFTKLRGKQVTSQQLGLIRATPEESPSEGQRDRLSRIAMEIMRMDKKRHDLIVKALQMSGATFTLPPAMSLDNLEQLVVAMDNPSRVGTPALAYLEGVIESCWHLSNASKITEVEQILPTYLPHLVTFAYQPSKHQQKAAQLTSQGYILAAELDRGNIHAMKAYCQQAILYSQIAENADIQVAALKQQATICLVGGDPATALLKYEEALPLINDISPLLRSRVYLGLASASARCNRKQDALRYLDLARESFPGQPEQDPDYLYSVCSRPVLYLYEALTYADLGQPENAWQALLTVDGLQPTMPVPISTRIEFLNLQAKIAAELGNLEQSASYLQASVYASRKYGYNLWLNEAQTIYQQLVRRWPHEPQIQALREVFEELSDNKA
jgi:tetratricopeptide (TPR) repeat protein/transcriptional regulator with XRE-family HTH domain